MDYNSSPAKRHTSAALAPTAAAAKLACDAIRPNFRYKAIYFNAAGSLDVIDTYGHVETITGAIGTTYPEANCGVQTGGGTTLTQGQFILLYD